MNKRQAKTESENNTRTWGELLAIVESADLTGMAKLNESLTRSQVAQIFRNVIAERDLSEVPNGLAYNARRDCMRISRDGLTMQNILREFG